MNVTRGGTGNLYSSLTVVTFLNQNLVERDDWICWLLRRIFVGKVVVGIYPGW